MQGSSSRRCLRSRRKGDVMQFEVSDKKRNRVIVDSGYVLEDFMNKLQLMYA